jgi:hypothetical protein
MADEQPEADVWTPDAVRNMDVVGIVERIDRIIYELMESESSNLNSLEDEDMTRVTEYNSSLRTYASVVNSSTRLDLPHSYPSMYDIKYVTKGVDYAGTKNRIIRDLVRLYSNAMVHWSRSESADKSNKFYEKDYVRFLKIMDRIDGYLTAYVAEATPLDLPESSAFEDRSTG